MIGSAGKTLQEMLLVMAVVALLLGIAGESFLAAASRTREMAARAEVGSELRMARQIALSRGERVRVSFETPGTRIRTELADRPGTVVREYDLSRSGLVVDSLSRGQDVTFYANGKTATPTTITLRSLRDGTVRKLTVSLTGRVSFK